MSGIVRNLPDMDATNPAAVSGLRNLLRRTRRHSSAAAGLTLLSVIFLSAVFAPLLATHSPSLANALLTLKPPSWAHLLGTDGAGRDVLSRLLYAGRYSLLGALIALAVSLPLGVISGLISGYFGGFLDSSSTAVASVLMSIPVIVVLLAARSVLGPSMYTSMLVFGMLISPAFYRLVYGGVNAVKKELYIDAARVAGLSDRRIIARHVLTVVRAPIIIQAAMVTGIAITVQAALEFLGLGDPKIPTWGNMLSDAFASMYQDRDLLIWPACMIALTCVSLILLANGLRDVLSESEPQPSRRQRRTASCAPPRSVASISREPVALHEEPCGSVSRSSAVLLEVSDLAIGYPASDGAIQLVVEGASLSVRRDEVHGLVGESGSGKTQTAFAILGVLPQGGRVVRGSVRFDGRDLLTRGGASFAEIRGKRIGYIPQEPMSNLDPSFTVGSQLAEPLRVTLGLSRRDATTTALEFLHRVGIVDPLRTFRAYPHEISGGMAQRVLIAGAVSCSPDLLIADEPTTALDVTVQADVLDLLRDLQRESHAGLIVVTHDFGVVADICDRVSVMQHGRIVESGDVRSVFKHPQHPYTQALFDAVVGKDEPDLDHDELWRVAATDDASEVQL